MFDVIGFAFGPVGLVVVSVFVAAFEAVVLPLLVVDIGPLVGACQAALRSWANVRVEQFEDNFKNRQNSNGTYKVKI